MSALVQAPKLSLQQTLSPQMRQSLQILQTPLMELKTLVAAEMALNPALEEELHPSPSHTEELPLTDKGPSPLEEEWNTYYVQSTPEAQQQRHQFLINSLTEPSTVQRFLGEQIRGMGMDRCDIPIATWIIGNINESGYLEASVEEIARLVRTDRQKVEAVLARIQTLEPAGIAARDLRECLLLQLQRQKKGNSLESKIVASHLEDLGGRKFTHISKKLRVSLSEVHQAAEFIARLDPKPGQAFAETPAPPIVPEIIVEQEEGKETEYRVSLNNDDLPRLRINALYKELLSQSQHPLEVRSYIRDKIRAGRFFISSIQQRQETILQIAQQIVAHQLEFLKNGPASLRPMTMAQMAQAVGLHEATISRAIAGKYMATPQGVFEMKYFFTFGYHTAEGPAVSSVIVRNALLEIIHKEDPANPWSDQEIADLLKEYGLPLIGRRTVTKYRDQLAILPSHLRKKI